MIKTPDEISNIFLKYYGKKGYKITHTACVIILLKESLFDLRHWLATADKLSETVLKDFDLVSTDLAEINFVDFSHDGS